MNLFLKLSMLLVKVISYGRSFHTLGAAHVNALDPLFVLERGILSITLMFERRARVGTFDSMSSIQIIPIQRSLAKLSLNYSLFYNF